MNTSWLQTCIFVLTALVAGHGWAQPGSASIPWDQLSPNEQQVLAPLKKSWDTLPAARQRRMIQGADRWAGMSAQDRLKAQTRLNQWKKLGPERKKRIRKSFDEFQGLPSSKRQGIRERRKRFKSLSTEQQQILREKWHKQSLNPRRPSRRQPGHPRDQIPQSAPLDISPKDSGRPNNHSPAGRK